MLRPRQEASKAGDGDPPILSNQIGKGRQQDVHNEPQSANCQEASIKSSSGSGSSLPYPFDSQSSLENEDGGLGMHHNITASSSRN